MALDFGGASTKQWEGDTTYAFDDSTGTCAAAKGGDLFYRLSLSAPKKVTVKVTRSANPASTAKQFTPVVYLREERNACDPTPEVEIGCVRSQEV